MNTDKLIPISYVKKITPMVVDDVIWMDYRKSTVVLEEQWQVNMANSDGDIRNFVVSFADRPNTGGKPDCASLMIDVEFNYGRKDKHKGADCFVWSKRADPAIALWKPNHAAMLKQYQAEQLGSNKDQSHHIALQIEALGEPGSPVEFIEELAENTSETHDVSVGDNGVRFSLTNVDNGEIQYIGQKELIGTFDVSLSVKEGDAVHIDDDGDKVGVAQSANPKWNNGDECRSKCDGDYIDGVVVGLFPGYNRTYVIYNKQKAGPSPFFICNTGNLKPIDTRTDEQKRVDNMNQFLESMIVGKGKVSTENIAAAMFDMYNITKKVK